MKIGSYPHPPFSINDEIFPCMLDSNNLTLSTPSQYAIIATNFASRSSVFYNRRIIPLFPIVSYT